MPPERGPGRDVLKGSSLDEGPSWNPFRRGAVLYRDHGSDPNLENCPYYMVEA